MASSLSGDADANEQEILPPIDACFLIRFDKRVGYTIAWSRAKDGCERRVLVTYLVHRPVDLTFDFSKH